MTTLRTAAQQALDALNSIDVGYRSPSGSPLEVSFDEGKCEAAITALRAALAQQDEPHPDYPCRSDGRCQYAIDHGAEGLGRCPKGKCAIAQPQPAEDRAVAQDNLRVMREMFGEQAEPKPMSPEQRQRWEELAAMPQQAEPVLVQGELPPRYVARSPIQADPVEPVAWECKAGGLKPLTQRQYDAQTAATKRHYTRIAPPQRLPLTEKEKRALADKFLSFQPESYEVSGVFDLISAVERAHGIKE